MPHGPLEQPTELEEEVVLDGRGHPAVVGLDSEHVLPLVEYLPGDHVRPGHLGEGRAGLLHRPVRERDPATVDQ